MLTNAKKSAINGRRLSFMNNRSKSEFESDSLNQHRRRSRRISRIALELSNRPELGRSFKEESLNQSDRKEFAEFSNSKNIIDVHAQLDSSISSQRALLQDMIPKTVNNAPEFFKGNLLQENNQVPLQTKKLRFFKLFRHNTSNRSILSYMIITTLFTVYSLFFDDIRVIALPQVSDNYFYAMTTITMIFFSIEIILSSISNDKYKFSFFFWLDLVQTVSLLFDIGWFLNSKIFQNIGAKAVVQSSRAARLTRIIRVLRVMRITRIVKLYRQARIAEERGLKKKVAEVKKNSIQSTAKPIVVLPTPLITNAKTMIPALTKQRTLRNNLLQIQTKNTDLSKTKDESNQQIDSQIDNQISKKISKQQKSAIITGTTIKKLIKADILKFDNKNNIKKEFSESSSDNSEEEKQNSYPGHQITSIISNQNSIAQFNNNTMLHDSRTSILSNNGNGINFYSNNNGNHSNNNNLSQDSQPESPPHSLLLQLPRSILKKPEMPQIQEIQVNGLQIRENHNFLQRKSMTRRFDLSTINKIDEEMGEKSEDSSFQSSSSSSYSAKSDDKKQMSFNEKILPFTPFKIITEENKFQNQDIFTWQQQKLMEKNLHKKKSPNQQNSKENVFSHIEPQSALLQTKEKSVHKNLKQKNTQSQKYNEEEQINILENFQIPPESQISRQFSNNTIQIVIIIIFATMIGLVLLDSATYSSLPISHEQGLKMLYGLYFEHGATDYYQLACEYYLNTQTTLDIPLILMQVPHFTNWQNIDIINSLRDNEITQFSLGENNIFTIIYATKKNDQINSIISITRTIFICIILMVSSAVLAYDAQRLVLNPIECMIEKVKILASDPLAASKQDPTKEGVLTKATKILQKQKKHGKRQNKCVAYFLGEQADDEDNNEILIIEKAIVKISTLLALGFGEAGTKYISKKITNNADDEQQAEFPEASDCVKIRALFAFANIRHFQASTEIMQQNVLLFVNKISEIVHTQVDKYGGCPNRNLGDTYLLVWKAQAYQQKNDQHRPFKKPQSSKAMMSDMAIYTAIKILAKLNALVSLKKYRQNDLLKKKIKDFKISIGFGLHYGWAIEGAIGSQFKVDLSYLSPNVNLSSRLCAATAQYGVDILFSQTVFYLMSDKMRDQCREIDTVTVKGSKQPLRMFTIDLNTTGMKEQVDRIGDMSTSKQRTTINIEKRIVFKKLLQGVRFSHQIIQNDHDFKEMRYFTKSNWYKLFLQAFKKAYKQYLLGEWLMAQQSLQECLRYNPTDGPTNSMMHYLEEQNLIPPQGWKGCHALSEK